MSLPPLAIDERLEAASTLPAAWYTDPQALALEQGGVFARTWQLVAGLADLEAPGDHVTAQVAGEPLVLVRDEEGRLRALSNVCRHRAGPVAGGRGNRKAFSCGYHGWTYGLDGRLLRAPEFEGVSDFDAATVRLPEFRCEAFGPLAFVKLDAEDPGLAAWMKEVATRTATLPLAQMRRLVRREYEVDCNWKVYVDNYLEGYHLPIVHPALFRELDYAAYRVEPLGHLSLQHAPIRRGAGADRRYANPEGRVPEAQYFWVFPNLMLNCYPDNLQVNLVLPLAADRTLTVFEWYFVDRALTAESDLVQRSVDFADEVQREDMAICALVQKGLRSRTYDRGRYSVRRENGVHHFHRLLARFLPNV